MYTSFFGLNEKPFSITPDPRYLFMSERHTEGLAHLLYGVRESGGFIQLTGEVGTGKTTLVRTLLQQLPADADVALILNPQLSRVEFLSAICEELGVPLPDDPNSVKSLTNALNAFLLRNHARGRHTILIVDEAQNLKLDVLEQVRLLTNLETAKQKLLQIILIGQPELREVLERRDMRQLAQRITGRYHLEPLSREETDAYVQHRLKVAGAVGTIFTPGARRTLYRHSGGVPRVINVIADRALLGAFSRESQQVTPAIVRAAAREVYGRRPGAGLSWLRWAGAGALLGLGLFTGFAWLGRAGDGEPAVPRPAPVLETAAGAPATPAAEPAADGPVLQDILASAGDATSTDAAFATLFRLWGETYRRGTGSACKQAEQHQLFCLFQRGSLAQVRGMDRPAILTLRDLDSNQHQVVLSGLGEQQATLTIGEQEYRVPLAELDRYWFGEYLLLWRPVAGEVKAYFPGMRDPGVRWIREALAAIQGRPATPMGSDLFDEALAERVREYQRQRRLTVDGLVGQQTQIAMITDLGAGDQPRLTRVN